MRKLLIGGIIIACAASYIQVSRTLQQSLTKKYATTTSELQSYSRWGLDVNEFTLLQTGVSPDLRPFAVMQIPWKYKHDTHILSTITSMASDAYATAIARKKSELDAHISYVRNRIVGISEFSETNTIARLKELQTISGMIFESNPTLVQIASAAGAISQIDTKITSDLEKSKKDALFSEIHRYKEQCERNRQFFSDRSISDGVVLSDECITQINKLQDSSYQSNGSQFLQTLVRERIYTAVTSTEQKKNRILQEEIFAELEKRKQQERLTLVPPAAVTSGKVVVVNVDLQRLYAYENGKSLFTYAVPITTGKQGFETVKGEFSIYYKQMYFKMTSPFPGIYYDNVVTYWMPFYLGYGLHDASWRSIYGTQDYPTVGSHGCVNIPFQEVAMLYNWAEVGTKVYVY